MNWRKMTCGSRLCLDLLRMGRELVVMLVWVFDAQDHLRKIVEA